MANKNKSRSGPKGSARGSSGIAVTFIVPHRPEESIQACVERIRAAKNSTVRSVKVQVIGVTGNQPSCQRNRAVAKARGELLYFLDNDSLLGPQSLKLGIDLFRKHPRVAVVGGPSLTPKDDTFLQKIFGLVLSSIFAVGPGIRSRYTASGRPRPASEYELILCNMLIRTDVFRKAGGFNEKMYPNEENILVNDIRAMGHQVYYHPGISVARSQRRSFREFVQQLLTYGRGRADQIFCQPNSFRLFHLIPAGWFLYIVLAVPLALVFGSNALAPLFLYLIVNAFFSLYTAFYHETFRALPLLPVLFFCVHFFYGAGMVRGTVRNLLNRAGVMKPRKKIVCRIDHESVV